MMRLALVASLVMVSCGQGPKPEPVPPPAPRPMAPAPVPAPAPAPEPDGRTAELLAVGEQCGTSADCASGICEGLGCGDQNGVCASKQRMCTADLVPYCGCDGATFSASSGCPKQRFRSRGPCSETSGATRQKPAGASCEVSEDCESGMCEGGCGPGQGFCVSRQRICTRDLRPYCGCDGVTFYGSGTCPNRRYSARATCNPGDRPPGQAQPGTR